MHRLVGALLLVGLAVPAAAVFPLPGDEPAVQGGVAWLRQRARDDGCVADPPGGECSHASTRDAALALSAAGEDPNAWPPAAATPIQYLGAHRAELENETSACDACRWAKTVVVLAAAGRDPRAFEGFDYVSKLDEHYENGQIGSVGQVNDDAWGLLAYAAANESDAAKIDTIRVHVTAKQNADGGWSWNLNPLKSDAWATATVALALLATGSEPDELAFQGPRGASAFLKSQQDGSGLMVQDGGESAESTAIAIQAIRALGADPAGPEWTKNGTSLVDAVLRLRRSDGGFAHDSRGNANWLATTQVLPALLGVPYPFRPPHVVVAVAAVPGAGRYEVEFRAHGEDPDGRVVHYGWSFDDGATAEGARALHAFERPGLHWARLRVHDDDGVARTVETGFKVDEAGVSTPTSPPPDARSGTAAGSGAGGAPLAQGPGGNGPSRAVPELGMAGGFAALAVAGGAVRCITTAGRRGGRERT